MKAATINHVALGVWAARIGEQVTVCGRKPNGLATAVKRKGERRQVYVPTRWLTSEEDRP